LRAGESVSGAQATAVYDGGVVCPGLSDHAWTIAELVQAMDAIIPKPGKRGSYKIKDSN
jgi:hypothetical protein